MKKKTQKNNRAWLFGACLLLFGSLFGGSSFVNAAPQKSAAEKRFEQAVRHFSKGEYEAALEDFEASYTAEKNPQILYNIAMCRKALFQYVESIAAFNEYLQLRKNDLSQQEKQKVLDSLKEMEQLIGRLRLKDAPNGAVVYLNGEKIGTTPLKEPIRLDPGQHKVAIEKPGFRTLETAVTIAAEAEVLLRAALMPATAQLKIKCETPNVKLSIDNTPVVDCPFEGSLEPGVHQIVATDRAGNNFEQEVQLKPGKTVTVSIDFGGSPDDLVEPVDGASKPGLVIGGVTTLALGLVSAGVGGYFTYRGFKDEEEALEKRSTIENSNNIEECLADYTNIEARYNEIRNTDLPRDRTVMIVGYAVGGALLVTGTVLLFLARRNKKESATQTVGFHPRLTGFEVSF